ncbi:MAG: GNAT family N-acetyltransferase [Candidatus Hodarchaeales archaeon]
MIKQITVDEINDLEDVISAYLEHRKEKYDQPPFPLREQIKKALSKEIVEVLALSDQEKSVTGFVMIQPSEGNLNLIYVMNSSVKENKEKELFDIAFARLKESNAHVKYTGLIINQNLANYMIDQGFRKFDRAKMAIDKSVIETLEEPELAPDYMFTSWKPELRQKMVKLLLGSHFNEDYADASVFPQWTSFDGCNTLLEEIENSKYGKFKAQHARVLKHDGKNIGVCFVTKLANNNGLIPEIVVSSSYRQKGLGKRLLIHSLKNFMKAETGIHKIELDVTLSNRNAAQLYESIGFQQVRKYSVYVWKK